MKKIKAWAIVSKKFEDFVERHPGLCAADVYFVEAAAKAELKKRYPKHCGECGKEKEKTEKYLKILPIHVTIAPELKKSKKIKRGE